MSTNENTPVETTEDDLDAFAKELFGQSTDHPEPASSEVVEDEPEEVSDAPEETEDTQTPEDDTLETDNEDDEIEEGSEEEEAENAEPEPKPKKKNRFQERIDDLVGKQREAERRAQELEQRLTEALQRLEQKNEKTETPEAPSPKLQAPDPSDKNEDGTDKYPLGEFDPNYIRDLARHTINEEREAQKAVEQEEQRRREEAARQQEIEQQKAQLETQWNEKLDTARVRYPDLNEKVADLQPLFQDVDETYGEYLAATLMSMDYGPDVLYYLSSHPDEAVEIVKSGATRATIALGRLEAKFAEADLEKQKARPKVSQAPTPPDTRLKGSNAVIPDVPDDTDDLEAFERKLFGKKR